MMKYAVAAALLVLTHFNLHAQYCIDGRFTDADYFDSTQVVKQENVQYGLGTSWFLDIVDPTQNTFDIAFPDTVIDPLPARPLILMLHGGAFWGGDKSELDTAISEFAREGFVAVTMNYRKGWATNGNWEECEGDGESLHDAMYKAMQDVRACLRFLVSNADNYHIDTSEIFIWGISAGSYTALNSVFISQDEWNSEYPYSQYLFGDLDHATNNIEATFDVKGCINISGGIMDIAFMNDEDLVPMISFFGTADETVPPLSGYFQNCPNYTSIFGSMAIKEKLDNAGICNDLHSRPGYGHVAYTVDYTIGNTACFIKSQFCSTCSNYVVEYSEGACSGSETTNIFSESENKSGIYPNPSQGVSMIQGANYSGLKSVSLLNANGEKIPLVFSQEGTGIMLNGSGLVDGIYLLIIQYDNTTETLKWIIQ